MYDTLSSLLLPVDKARISEDAGYREGQIGYAILAHEEEGIPDISEADIVIIGCTEQRGAGLMHANSAADSIRTELYNLYYWHHDIRLADLGNVRTGKTVADTYAALKMVLQELSEEGKLVVILGGSHDLTLAQYQQFADQKQQIEAVGVDAVIDINIESPYKSEKFLLELLTAEPNYMGHYSHLAFQSYFVHPRMLETMDKLRFDCYRVGAVRERIEEAEPAIRGSHIFSFDINAIAAAYAPANVFTPNGLTGEDACILMQYAGMSTHMRTIGIYGFRPEQDRDTLTSRQISQMLWYLMDGRSRGLREAHIDERDAFNEFHTTFSDVDTVFLQSKRTGRWWMQLPDKKFIACSYKDYQIAAANEYPERWMRHQERP
jgi:arginase family enzyme